MSPGLMRPACTCDWDRPDTRQHALDCPQRLWDEATRRQVNRPAVDTFEQDVAEAIRTTMEAHFKVRSSLNTAAIERPMVAKTCDVNDGRGFLVISSSGRTLCIAVNEVKT